MKKIIFRKQMEGATKYDYCPYCVKELENDGKSWRETLRPLLRVKTAEEIYDENGNYTGKDIIDTHYECSRCHSERITVDTFVREYCCRPDGKKYGEGNGGDRRGAACEMAYAKATKSAV